MDDTPRILDALAAVPGVTATYPAWPETWESLPCIIVSEAANRADSYRDDEEYTTELEYYVRVVARTAADRSRIASDADDVMQGLGYRRINTYDEDGTGIRQKAILYRQLFPTGGI